MRIGRPSLRSLLVRTRARRITRRDAAAAISRLAALTAAGVATGDAIASSARSGAPLLVLLHAAVRRGTALSAAMSHRLLPFGEAEIAMVRAGERGGSTPRVLELLAARMEREAGGRRRIASALAYPALLAGGGLAALGFLSIVVLPSFTTLYTSQNAELPWVTGLLLAFGSGVQAWGGAALFASLVAGAAFFVARREHAGFDRFCDRVALDAPPFRSLVAPNVAHETCALLALLLEAGCEAEEAMSLASRAAPNRVAAERLGDALRALRHGVPLSRAWRSSGLDRSGDAAPLLEIAEATGGYAQAFSRLAVLEGAAAEHALAQACRLAEPVSVVVMAVAVGGGVLALCQLMLGSASLLLGGSP